MIESYFNSSSEDMIRGFSESPEQFTCLLCGAVVEKGIIYPVENKLLDAGRYMAHHITETHGSVFQHLISLDKRQTGLSEHQGHLMQLFYDGKTDGEVQKEMQIGSASTVRNHRFLLKEKEKQAKIFLTLMTLLKQNDPSDTPVPAISGRARKTALEQPKDILAKYFPGGLHGRLSTLSMQLKHKLVVLEFIAKRLEPGKQYSEKKLNKVLKSIFEFDYVALRRELIDHGFLERTDDGSQYWVRFSEDVRVPQEKNTTRSKKTMKEPQIDRKALIAEYKETRFEAGIFKITNLQTGTDYFFSSIDLRNEQNKLDFAKKTGLTGVFDHRLEKDMKQFGTDAFSFVILESFIPEVDLTPDQLKEKLKTLLNKWQESASAN